MNLKNILFLCIALFGSMPHLCANKKPLTTAERKKLIKRKEEILKRRAARKKREEKEAREQRRKIKKAKEKQQKAKEKQRSRKTKDKKRPSGQRPFSQAPVPHQAPISHFSDPKPRVPLKEMTPEEMAKKREELTKRQELRKLRDLRRKRAKRIAALTALGLTAAGAAVLTLWMALHPRSGWRFQQLRNQVADLQNNQEELEQQQAEMAQQFALERNQIKQKQELARQNRTNAQETAKLMTSWAFNNRQQLPNGLSIAQLRELLPYITDPEIKRRVIDTINTRALLAHREVMRQRAVKSSHILSYSTLADRDQITARIAELTTQRAALIPQWTRLPLEDPSRDEIGKQIDDMRDEITELQEKLTVVNRSITTSKLQNRNLRQMPRNVQNLIQSYL